MKKVKRLLCFMACGLSMLSMAFITPRFYAFFLPPAMGQAHNKQLNRLQDANDYELAAASADPFQNHAILDAGQGLEQPVSWVTFLESSQLAEQGEQAEMVQNPKISPSASSEQVDSYPVLTGGDALLVPSLTASINVSQWRHNEDGQLDNRGPQYRGFIDVALGASVDGSEDGQLAIPRSILLCISAFIGLVAVARRNRTG